MAIIDKRIDAGKAFDWGRTSEELAKWDDEHKGLLDEIAPERFEVLHYAALAVLHKKKQD